MKKANQKTLSIVSTVPVRKSRTTQQTLHILEFIHRFRHVTARHIQLSLRHAIVTTTHNQLNTMRAKGLIDRHYSQAYKKANRPASYYLTIEGLALLQAHYPEWRLRGVRSIKADAIMGRAIQERYHTLADVYVHFKRHYDGHFEFWSAFDFTSVEYKPDEVPDGYVRLSLPDSGTQHYYVEIYGWGRPTQIQQRRLRSYFQFAESEPSPTGESSPNLFIVTRDQAAQRRINALVVHSLEQSLADNFYVCTTDAAKLDSETPVIWLQIQYSYET